MKKLTLALIIAGSTLMSNTAFAQTASTLDKSTVDGLVLMREEEKLAKDVYAKLGEIWDTRVFTNITKAEEKHMSRVGELLEKYGIEDPIKSSEQGVFTSPEMQKLYDELIDKGDDNLLAALKVGAEIEELDIADLMKELETVDEADIVRVYENLTRGSRNHLRAFMRQIEKQGGTYTPTHISQKLFDDILASEQEKGQKGQGKNQSSSDCQGKGKGQSQGQG